MKIQICDRQVYVSDNEFIICPIVDEDRDNYVELHRQINGEHTLFLNKHCKDMMWEQVLEGEDKVFSVFEINGDYCGSLELQNPDSDTPEIGIDLLENKRNKGIAPKVVKLLAKRCYKDRKVDYFLIRILSQNQHSKHVFEKMGVIPLRTTESPYKTFMKALLETAGDISNDKKEELKNILEENDEPIEEEVYEYKLMPEIFL